MGTADRQPGAPNAVETGDTGATIQIEQLDNGVAVVRVIYPDDRRWREVNGIGLVGFCLCLAVAIAWFLFGHSAAGRSGVGVAAIFVIYFMIQTLMRFYTVSRSWVFRADHTGITIETRSGQRTTTRYFTFGQISDIGVRFDGGKTTYTPTFTCWLVIDPEFGSEVRCLYNLGGNHLARIANVLRAAMRMPERSWP